MKIRRLEYLFTEASGLADPANMPQILEGIKHKVKEGYTYRGSICVIDGETFLELYELLPALHHQVEYSSAAIINKADLIDENTMMQIKAKIKQINPALQMQSASYCKVDIKSIIEGFDFVHQEGEETTNTVESRPKTFILKGRDMIEYEKLEALIHLLAKDAYRMKGFAITQKGNVEISTVGKHVNINDWKDPITESKIVIISSVGIKMMSNITQALKNYPKETLYLTF